MTKVLNLDNLAEGKERELVLFGKTYKVLGMTVANFIATTKAAEKLTDESTFAEQVEATVETIQRAVPGIEREVLLTLSLEQLRAVIEFVRGEEPEGAEPVVEGDEAKKE